MRVLVTGASGFLGRYVVRSLVERGHEVRALVRKSSRVPDAWPAGIDIAHGDLGSPASLRAAVEGQEAVVHLAAKVGGGDAEQFAVTVGGTERLLAAMVGTDVRRFVLASSFSVYDWNSDRRRLDEDTPTERRWWERDGYAASKIWQERIVREAAASAPWDLVVLRPGFIWGPENPACPGVGEQVGSAMVVVGWRTRLPLTWVENCADAFALAITADVLDGTTVNVVDDELVTSRTYASASAGTLGVQRRLLLPYPVARGLSQAAKGVSRRWFSESGGRLPSALEPRKFQARFRPFEFPNEQAKRLLGWVPRVSWDEAKARAFVDA